MGCDHTLTHSLYMNTHANDNAPSEQPAGRLEEEGGAQQLQHRQDGRHGKQHAPAASVFVVLWVCGVVLGVLGVGEGDGGREEGVLCVLLL